MTSHILPLVLPLLIIAGALVVIAYELGSLSRRLRQLAPPCEAALTSAQRALSEAETLLARCNHMTEQTEAMLRRGWMFAHETLDALRHWRQRWHAGGKFHGGNGTASARRAAGKSP